MSNALSGYAHALLRVAEETGVTARVAEELPQVENIIWENAHYFENPAVPAAQRIETLQRALEGQTESLVLQFIAQLIMDRRLHLLPRIRRLFETLAESALGRFTVRLRVRYRPDEARLQTLRESLAHFGLYPPESRASVVFEVVIDEKILGGFIAECRGHELDASLRTRLEKLYQ